MGSLINNYNATFVDLALGILSESDALVLTGDLIDYNRGFALSADGAIDEILSGGWYFATEVARILGATGAVTPEQGAALLRGSRSGGEAAVDPGRDVPSLNRVRPHGSGREPEHPGGGIQT